MATTAPPVVEARDLHKFYGRVEAVRGVSFEVLPGEIFGVLGPNGAGKTSTLEMLEGLLRIDEGSARVLGLDVAREPRQVRRSIGIQLQRADFFDRLSLGELLGLFADLYGRAVDPRRLLAQVGLESFVQRRIKELSGGERQRFSLAVTLVNDPRVLFLDEPSTGLDPRSRRELWALIQSLRDQGRSVLLTTHYIEEAQFLCDRVAIMDVGRIVRLGSPAELVRQLLATGFHKDVVVPPATLEDVFLQVTGRPIEDRDA